MCRFGDLEMWRCGQLEVRLGLELTFCQVVDQCANKTICQYAIGEADWAISR